MIELNIKNNNQSETFPVDGSLGAVIYITITSLMFLTHN
jgi:hypothetical protein